MASLQGSCKSIKRYNTSFIKVSISNVVWVIIYSNRFKETLTQGNISYVSFFFFFFSSSICLDVPHVTNEHRTQDCIAS